MSSISEDPDTRSWPKRQRRPRLGRIGRGILLRFVLFAALSLLLIIAMVGYAGWRQYSDIHALQGQLAQWTASALDAWLREIDYSLVALSDPELPTLPVETVEARLRAVLLRNNDLRSVTLVDGREGREVVTVGRGAVSHGTDLRDKGWFSGALEQGTFIAPVDFSQVVPVVTVARKIERNGQTVGVLAAQADLSWASSLLTRTTSLEAAYIYVVDGEGHPLLHLSTQFVYPQRVRTDIAGIQAATSGQPMPMFYQGLNRAGWWVVGTYCPLQQVSWMVVVEQPVQDAGRRVLPLGLGALGILLLSGLAATVVGAYISRRVALPIARLQEGARRIGRGEMDHRLEVHGRGELADLAAEFNRMAENVQSSRADLERSSIELERRVQERTQELSQALAQQQHEALVRENLLRTIREMSSPVLPVLEGILVMPIIGTLDSERAQRVMADLLAAVERQHAHVVLIDITGLAVVDTAVANALLQSAQAARILGAEPILVGITPAVAETLVQLGVDIRLRTAATLQEGLQTALRIVHRSTTAAP